MVVGLWNACDSHRVASCPAIDGNELTAQRKTVSVAVGIAIILNESVRSRSVESQSKKGGGHSPKHVEVQRFCLAPK